MTELQRDYVIGGNPVARNHELESAQRQPIVGIAATRIVGDTGCGDEALAWDAGVQRPIRMGDILFAFTKGAVGAAPLIVAPWAKKILFAETTVYIRTADGLYRTHFCSLKALKKILPDSFQQVSRSVLANLVHVEELQLQGSASRVHTLTYSVESNALSSWGYEQLRVGREFLSAVRARFGYPRFVSERALQEGASACPSTVHRVGTGSLANVLLLGG